MTHNGFTLNTEHWRLQWISLSQNKSFFFAQEILLLSPFSYSHFMSIFCQLTIVFRIILFSSRYIWDEKLVLIKTRIRTKNIYFQKTKKCIKSFFFITYWTISLERAIEKKSIKIKALCECLNAHLSHSPTIFNSWFNKNEVQFRMVYCKKRI
jgi:hypothetical protein